MRNNIIFAISAAGLCAGLVSAFLFGMAAPAQPPVFQPVSNPYPSAIYANGMVESEQSGGENINLFPEVPGTITNVLVHEGQSVTAGTPLLTIDDTFQKAATEQLRLQSEAAFALLQELKAQPRKETLEIAKAQVELAETSLKTARDQFDKRRSSYELDQKSISKDALDNAKNADIAALAALQVAQRQYELTKAGAWSYDIRNQERQYEAMKQSYQAAAALLGKFTIRAHADGVIMTINAAPGSFVSSQGAYDTYTQGTLPLVVMGATQDFLAVRCFIDEILVSRLPSGDHMKAEMSIRGTDIKVPLQFVRIQPYISPKIELSNQRQEKVDLRVLPVIFRFSKKDLPMVYPGQQVDIFVGQK